MSFLDRFKPQPRWKHADPLVRAAAIAEIPDDREHRDVITELAQADEDVRVRRAAVARLIETPELARLARTEADEELRREIAERLVGIATAPAESDGEAAQALEGLDDQKHFATVAKTSPYDTVRTAALARIHDTKILSSVARHAADGQTALDAVARIADAGELINIAIKTDHKDAGVAALERAAEAEDAEGDLRETFETVATRAKNKGVARRARAMMQAIDDAEAARKAAQEQWQQRIASLMARVEALAAAPAAADASIQLGDAEAEWRELAGAGLFEMDQDTMARFGALLAQARSAIDHHERQQAEMRAAEERAAALLAVRTALCERIDALRSEDAIEQIEQARAEWAGLADEDTDARLAARFEDACRRAADRHRNRVELQRVHARLEELSHEAERVSADDALPEHAWTAVMNEWRTASRSVETVDVVALQRVTDAEARVRLRADERRVQAEKSLRQHMQRIEQLVDRAHKRAAAEDLTLREADRLARDLRSAVEVPLPGVDEREQHVLLERVKSALAAIGPRLHELREMDEWKRFANAAVQEELIARTEALRSKYPFDNPEILKDEDLAKAAQELHDIQEKWKTVAEAPRAQAQALWHRYRQAADPIQARVRDFFAHRAEERKTNLEKKLALIERAEALADSTDWIRTAEELKRLQAEWQQLGPVPRQDTKATWKRFRDACDHFFTRRNADLAQRKETWSANLARKEALCARAEELASSTEWDKGAAEIRRMQAEWKNVGPVRRNKSEAIWQRFRAACDTFFDRYKRRDQIELEAKQADREALVTEMESLVTPSMEQAPMDAPEDASGPALLERVRSLRTRWNQTTPVVRQGADPLSARFMGALERLIATQPAAFRGTELDVDANRQKMEKLCARVEGFVAEAGAAAPAGSSQALAAMLREALAANTIGGRAGEESKWRAMSEDVRQAQSAWSRLGPVPGDTGRELSERFHRACNRFFEQYRRRVPQQQPQRGGRPVGAR
jgi:hypothetical protein